MNNKTLLKLMGLGMMLAWNFVTGCSSMPDTKEQMAVAVAKQEVHRRGWKKVEVKKVRFESGRWIVDLWRLPKVPGGTATVEVSEDGNVVRFIPGL